MKNIFAEQPDDDLDADLPIYVICGVCTKSFEGFSETQANDCAADIQEDAIYGHYGSTIADMSHYTYAGGTRPDNLPLGRQICDACIIRLEQEGVLIHHYHGPAADQSHRIGADVIDIDGARFMKIDALPATAPKSDLIGQIDVTLPSAADIAKAEVQAAAAFAAFAEEMRPLHNQMCILYDTDVVRLVGVGRDESDFYYITRSIRDKRGVRPGNWSSAVGHILSLKGLYPAERYAYMDHVFGLNDAGPSDEFIIIDETKMPRRAIDNPDIPLS